MDLLGLNKETKEILKSKAKLFNKSEQEILEWMILEFGDSTKEEKLNQTQRKRKAKNKYFLERYLPEEEPIMRKIWENGFSTGWSHYQIRKDSHPFIRYKDGLIGDNSCEK